MSNEPFSGEHFELDTRSMSEIAGKCEKIANRMRTMKQDLDDAKTRLVAQWHGEGSSTFQKKYHFLVQQLKDLSENLYDLAEEIRTAEDAYIQADMDAAKLMDGKSEPA